MSLTFENGWLSHSSPKAAGFSQEAVNALQAELEGLPTTSFMIVRGGKIVWSYGDISRASYIASCRKSILSLLYGRHVTAGIIDLTMTLDELGIDEPDGLTAQEKSATIGDVLLSASGVYYPPGSPGSDVSDYPSRGSQSPGYFYYNNWDFNVAGEIFTRLTSLQVHDALRDYLAIPLGFEDFDRNRQKMLRYPIGSQFPAYHMFLSARDMARIGVMMLQGGRWSEKQIIDREWLIHSTSEQISPQDMHGTFQNGNMGYGNYWWTPRLNGSGVWEGSYMALGHFGQMLLCLPELDIVIVHRRSVSDQRVINRHHHGDTSEPPSVKATTFLELTEGLLQKMKH